MYRFDVLNRHPIRTKTEYIELYGRKPTTPMVVELSHSSDVDTLVDVRDIGGSQVATLLLPTPGPVPVGAVLYWDQLEVSYVDERSGEVATEKPKQHLKGNAVWRRRVQEWAPEE